MKWRVMVELGGAEGALELREVSAGECPAAACSAETLGLTVAEGKKTLAGLQRHLVQAQTDEHCRSRRRCEYCGAQRPLKDIRPRRLTSLFGVVEVHAPRFGPCRCGVASRRTITPVAEIMPDRRTPKYERTLAKMGALLPYRRARSLLEEYFPLGDAPEVETIRQRTLHVGARLEREAVAPATSVPPHEAQSIALAIDGGHVKAVRSYQGRSFEVLVAQVSNDDGKQVVFSSMPAEADRQVQQLRRVLYDLGATSRTPVTILRRLWHGQVRRALDLIGETLVTLEATAKTVPSKAETASKVVGVLRALETYVSGQSELIIDYATARGTDEPISTATTESTVQWLLHRRMGANQQMRWSPRGAHLMLKVRTSVVNGTFNKNSVTAERWARRPFHKAA